MNVLIYCPYISGHFLEYINHIYHVCIRHEENKYIFVLHPDFVKVKERMTWMHHNGNISFDYLTTSELSSSITGNLFKASFNTAKYIGRKVKHHNAQKVFLPLLISATPFMPLFMSSRVKVSGIIYMIYLYRLVNASFRFKLLNKLKYLVFTKFNVFDNVLILNDQKSVDSLNRIYGVTKFKYIPDPYIPLPANQSNRIRTQYNFASNDKLYIHIGAMNENKGSKEILLSLIDMDTEDLANKVFFFAGKVENEIKEDFYQLFDKVRKKARIELIDDFCSFELFGQLCQECDAIIIPYKRTSQSSGIIGYASQFGKPVIGPESGLLGNLIKEYKLGITLREISSENLIKAYKMIEEGTYEKPNNFYCSQHTIKSFQDVIEGCVC